MPEKTEETMTFAQADEFQRKLILDAERDPKSVTLPGGKTLSEFRRGQEEAERKLADEARERELEAMRRDTSAVLPDVVRVSPEAGIVPTDELPEDFPGRAALAEAGLTKRPQVAASPLKS